MRTVVSAVLVLAVSACAPSDPESVAVLDIDGRELALADFEDFVASSRQEAASLLSGDVLAALFEQFIEEQLLLRAAQDAGIEVKQEILARELEALASLEIPDSEEETETVSSPRQTSGTEQAARLEAQLKIRELVEQQVLGSLSVSDEDMRLHYEQHRDYYHRPETVTVSQILVDTREQAESLRAELVADASRFEELAAEYSTAPEAGRGGSLGSFRHGELPPSFEREVFDLAPGKLSEVVATDFGFHVFRVDAKTEPVELSQEMVADAVRVTILRQKSELAMEAYVTGLRERYPVTIYREHLSFPFLAWQDEATGNVTQKTTPRS